MNTRIGIGPHPKPWPTDERYDPELLEKGDARNVIDKYRYWTESAIIDNLDANGSSLEIAIENLERDFNMGTIVRNANAFGVRHIHVIGRRQWNKRGAMKTDTYLHIHYYPDASSFIAAMKRQRKQVIAVDIVDDAVPLEQITMSHQAVLVFGQEGPGLSHEMLSAADAVGMVSQRGSTRSMNVGVAAGIAMYIWTSQPR